MQGQAAAVAGAMPVPAAAAAQQVAAGFAFLYGEYANMIDMRTASTQLFLGGGYAPFAL